jgi:hypothetical protein
MGPRPFSFLGNQSNRLSQGRAKQTRSSFSLLFLIASVKTIDPRMLVEA